MLVFLLADDAYNSAGSMLNPHICLSFKCISMFLHTYVTATVNSFVYLAIKEEQKSHKYSILVLVKIFHRRR